MQNNLFEFEEIKDLFEKALKRLLEKEYHLIEHKTSERLIVHWLAIYFHDEINKYINEYKIDELSINDNNDIVLETNKQKKLKIDVEYNRFGSKRLSKHLQYYCDCGNCDHYKKQCVRSRACTIDMIFHERGTQDNNIFCAEVKPPWIGNERIICDKKRIEALVRPHTANATQPSYSFGAAIHILNNKKIEGIYYRSDSSEPLPLAVP